MNEHEQLVARLLNDSGSHEVVSWLSRGSPNEGRTVGRFASSDESLKFVKSLYELGALEILAVQIERHFESKTQHTGKLVIKLPTGLDTRQAIFDWCRQQGESLGFSPDPDRGETHLFLLLD